MWDGTQWVPEVRPTPTPPKPAKRWSNRVSNALLVIGIIAMVVPFTAGFAATSPDAALAADPGAAPAGATVTVTGTAFPAGAKVVLTWDGKLSWDRKRNRLPTAKVQ